MKNVVYATALISFAGISNAGQGIFLDVNNFTNDVLNLQHEDQVSWKVGGLGGSNNISSCASKTIYTETNSWPEWAWNSTRLDVGFGEDRQVGSVLLWYGSSSKADELLPGWEYSKAINEYFGTTQGGKPRYVDGIYLWSNINRIDGGDWKNGVVGTYVFNDGKNQDLVNLTVLPKHGDTNCPINKKMFDFVILDRFARAIRNHPKDFKITYGPQRIVSNAIERGLVSEGYTFITDLPGLDVIEKPLMKANNEKTIIKEPNQGSYDPAGNKIPDGSMDTWTTGLYCNQSSNSQSFTTPVFNKTFSAKSTTTTKHGWGVGLELKVSAGADIKFVGGKVEKTLKINYSGETGKSEEFTETESITMPSQTLMVEPGKCKRLTYSVSASEVSSEVYIDYEINPNTEYSVRLFSGLSKSEPWAFHKEYVVHGKLIDLLNRKEDGYIPPQIVIENAGSQKTSKVFIRGIVGVEGKSGYTASAIVTDARPPQ